MCIPCIPEKQDLVQHFVSGPLGCRAASGSQGGPCTREHRKQKQIGTPRPTSTHAVQSKQTKTGRELGKPAACASGPDTVAGTPHRQDPPGLHVAESCSFGVQLQEQGAFGCFLAGAGKIWDSYLWPAGPPLRRGAEPHPADGGGGCDRQGSARHPLQCWSFACLFLFLAGKAGRVGCKPCPWNLLSQLGSRMRTTSDREMERHRKEPGWKTSSQVGRQEAKSQCPDIRRGLKSHTFSC